MRMHVNMHNLISCSFMSDKQNDTKIKKPTFITKHK